MNSIDLSRAVWQKSSRSNGQANCVEVAANLPGVVAIRDSKDPHGPVLVVSREGWQEFTNGVRGVGLGRGTESSAASLARPMRV